MQDNLAFPFTALYKILEVQITIVVVWEIIETV